MINSRRKPGDPRHSERDSLRPVTFLCAAPQARSVKIAGDFNQWRPVPMQQRTDGWWYCQLLLCQGHHQYRFLVDGKATLDPGAAGIDRNHRGMLVSLITVI